MYDSNRPPLSTLQALLNPEVVRTYSPGPSTSRPIGVQVPSPAIPIDSAKDSVTVSAPMLAAVRARIDALGPNAIVIDQHEPEQPSKGIDPAAWVKMQKAIIADNPGALVAPCLMAWTLDPASGRNPESYYVDTAPLLAFDAYGLSQITLAAKYAAAKAKPWIIAELGIHPQGSTASYPSDTELLAWLKSAVALIKSLPNPPRAVSLMNHLFQLLDGVRNPLSTAYWATVR
jgi:hypothetical protein